MIEQVDSSAKENSTDGEKVTDVEQPLWKWCCAIIFLACITITTGAPNLYPALYDNMKAALGISDSICTFMLTGGVMIMYITLPAGLLMDKFGTDVVFLGSVLLTVISYIVLPFTYKVPGLFVAFYLFLAFGCSSLFIVVLEIALSRSPAKIKGISGSVVSATLSFSFGLFLEVYKQGDKVFGCKGYACVFSNIQFVAIIVCVIIVVCSPIAYFFFRNFKYEHHNGPKPKNWAIFYNYRFYLLLFGMLHCVFDGLLVVSAGAVIWPIYGKGYPNGASDWGIVFSSINMVCTILLSVLLDFLIHKTGWARPKLWGLIWTIQLFIPFAIGFIFKYTDNQTLFGIFMSMMGIPFGFGLSQIPALTSDFFGFELFGFVFGLVQIGSIISAATVMPIVQVIGKTGIMVAFLICGCVHIVIGVGFFLSKSNHPTAIDEKNKEEQYNEDLEANELSSDSSATPTSTTESS